MMGGLQGGRVITVSSPEFPVAQTWDLDSASQASVSETASQTAATPSTFARAQDLNATQVFRQTVTVTYIRQASGGYMASAATPMASGDNPVNSELDFQIMANMAQVSRNAEYTFLNGAYQRATSASVAGKTRGIITACSTNTVAAGSVTLSKSLIDQLLRTMAGNGSVFADPVIFCNAFQKQKVSDIYGYAPQDRNIGGVNIKQIETDFAMLGIVYAPQVPAATLLIADMSVVRPVFQPVPQKGLLFYEPLAKNGAVEKGEIFGLMGLAYGPEEYHGTITGLATS